MSKLFVRNLLNLFLSLSLFAGLSIPLLIFYGESSSGFTCLLFNDYLMGNFAMFCGVLIWLCVICLLVSIIISTICLIKTKHNFQPTLVTLILTGFSAITYLITGVVSSVISGGSTLAYLFFLLFILFCAPIIILSLLADKPECSINQVTESKTSNITTFNDPEAVYIMDGEAKTLFVYKEHIKISIKQNVRSLVTHNLFGGEKKIYYDNILGVQFRPCTSMVLGYIQVELANDFSKNNFNSEGSVTFSDRKISNEKAQEIADYIDNRIREIKQPKQIFVDNNFSKADELLKYKTLLDQGVLTEEEFAQKKKELLGL